MSVRTTRREVLKVGGAAAASMAVSSLLERVSAAGVLAPAWKNLPIGTQAWCVRKQLATDIPGTLAMVSKAGFELLELENAFGKSGAEWKAALDAAKLKPAGFHHTLAELFPDKLNATIEFNQALGNQNLIIRSLPPAVYNSVDMLKQTTEVINGVAEKLKPHKLRVGYHNHTTDFNRLDGEYWWNRFADLTSKDVVLQFDTGNASEKEGVDVVEVLKRNPGRVKSMHVKPFSKASPNAFIGADELNWPAIMTAAETVAGVELYIIEYEKDTGRPPIDDLTAEPRGLQEAARLAARSGSRVHCTHEPYIGFGITKKRDPNSTNASSPAPRIACDSLGKSWMLSPTNATTVSGGSVEGSRPLCTASKRGFLSDGPVRHSIRS